MVCFSLGMLQRTHQKQEENTRKVQNHIWAASHGPHWVITRKWGKSEDQRGV
jgi:hypothetical protein